MSRDTLQVHVSLSFRKKNLISFLKSTRIIASVRYQTRKRRHVFEMNTVIGGSSKHGIPFQSPNRNLALLKKPSLIHNEKVKGMAYIDVLYHYIGPNFSQKTLFLSLQK
jgi:hypothetical protein